MPASRNNNDGHGREGGRRSKSRRRLRDGGTRNIYYAVGRLAKRFMFVATFAGTLVGVGQQKRAPRCSVLAFVVFAPSSTMPNHPSSRASPGLTRERFPSIVCIVIILGIGRKRGEHSAWWLLPASSVDRLLTVHFLSLLPNTTVGTVLEKGVSRLAWSGWATISTTNYI